MPFLFSRQQLARSQCQLSQSDMENGKSNKTVNEGESNKTVKGGK